VSATASVIAPDPEPDGRGGRRGAQLHRTLFLLRDLDQGWQSRDALAAKYAVTARTIYRDIAFLRAHGFEIAERGVAHDGPRPGDLSWRLGTWPDSYDLTEASPCRPSRPV